MRRSESLEHKKLKNLFKDYLKKWFNGIVIEEHPTTGNIADIYGRISDKILIHLEVIWTPSRYNENIKSLLISKSNIKGVIFSPKTYEKFCKDYDKLRIEYEKNYIFLEPIFGDKILEEDMEYINRIKSNMEKQIHTIDVWTQKNTCLENVNNLSSDISVILTPKFPYERFKSNFNIYRSISNNKTKLELLTNMRNNLTSLPYDGLSEEEKIIILNFLDNIKDEVYNNKNREKHLEIIKIILQKRDNCAINYIKELFMDIITKKYNEFSIIEKSYSMRILQILYNNDNDFIRDNIYNSITKWSDEEFTKIRYDLSIDHLDKNHREKIKINLWKMLEEFENKKDLNKIERVKYYLNLGEFS